MSRSHSLKLGLVLAMFLTLSTVSAADSEEFRFGHDIHIAAEQTVNEATCINCSIYIRGHVAGDVFAMNGDVVLETGAQVSGDIATMKGDVRVADEAQVGGDVAAIAGTVRKQASATIGGDVASLAGSAWTFFIFAVPLMVLGALLALIVWLVSRVMKPAPVRASASTSQVR